MVGKIAKKDWGIFISSIFFVLGFSLVFSIVGILLQHFLTLASSSLQTWLSRIGGMIIIFFGILMLDILPVSFLQKEYKFELKKKVRYGSSFLFGAAFAVAWTPCVGPVLGSVLTLAITHPGNAFFLLLAYSLGLGIPFLLVGLFTNQVKQWINHSGKWIVYFRIVFAVFLIFIGLLIITNSLHVMTIPILTDLFVSFNVINISFGNSLHIGIAFLAGIVSFLSPCILPLLPAYLTYLATHEMKGKKGKEVQK